MIFFLDSSCIVRSITGDGKTIPNWGTWESAWASRIAAVEVVRTFRRLRLQGAFSDGAFAAALAEYTGLASGIEWLPVDEAVLTLASEEFPMHLKTIDALHVASARVVREAGARDLVFATHDRRLGAVAASFGFAVLGV